MFKGKNLAVLLGALAAAAAFSAPLTASAGEDQFARQLSLSDGYQETDWDRAHSGTAVVLTPASPEAQAQLANFERQRNISDGYQETGWDERQSSEFQTMMAQTTDPMQQAQLANFEAQRRISDGTN
jgi:hypothetical protein